jgi:hypothetical protein
MSTTNIFENPKLFHTKILEEWSKDCQLNETKLDHESIRIPALHSKYLNYLQYAKKQCRAIERKHTDVIFKRQQWYDGRLSKEEMDELGWEYDPFKNQLVKTKEQKNRYYDADVILLKAKEEIEQWKSTIDAIEKMLTNITWRHQIIRSAIDFQRLMAGVL